MHHAKKLVLFDIDGTLIRPVAAVEAVRRFPYAIKKVFGLNVHHDIEMWKTFNGWSDRSILWAYVERYGISKKMFLSQLDALGDAFVDYLNAAAQKQTLYEPIKDAQSLFMRIHAAQHMVLGTLTGNLPKSAHWKCAHVGIAETYIRFGIYGHEADLRDDLARLVIPKAKQELGTMFDPSDIIFIGDTVHDIRCARAIGASVVAVSTGWNIPKETLKQEKPDLLVDSLLDERVLKLLGLGQ